jgi:hypothetical protein
MFKGSIRIFQGLFEYIKGLIARNINLGFNWKKLKAGGRVAIFRS